MGATVLGNWRRAGPAELVFNTRGGALAASPLDHSAALLGDLHRGVQRGATVLQQGSSPAPGAQCDVPARPSGMPDAATWGDARLRGDTRLHNKTQRKEGA